MPPFFWNSWIVNFLNDSTFQATYFFSSGEFSRSTYEMKILEFHPLYSARFNNNVMAMYFYVTAAMWSIDLL